MCACLCVCVRVCLCMCVCVCVSVQCKTDDRNEGFANVSITRVASQLNLTAPSHFKLQKQFFPLKLILIEIALINDVK